MECTQVDHVQPTHQYELISDVADKQMAIMETLVQDARLKHSELLETYKVRSHYISFPIISNYCCLGFFFQ